MAVVNLDYLWCELWILYASFLATAVRKPWLYMEYLVEGDKVAV